MQNTGFPTITADTTPLELAKAITTMTQTSNQQERKAIQDQLNILQETNGPMMVLNLLQVLTEAIPTQNEEETHHLNTLKMSVAIFIKNAIVRAIVPRFMKQARSLQDQQASHELFSQLAVMVQKLTEACLSSSLEGKFKNNLRDGLTKTLNCISILSKTNPEFLNQIIEELNKNVKEGLKPEMDVNCQIGAVLLCEDIAKVMRGDRFVMVFEQLIQSLQVLTEAKIDAFKSTLQMLSQNGMALESLQTQDPHAQSLMQNLEVLKFISNSMFRTCTVIESSQNEQECEFMIRSMAFAQIFLQMICLTGENKIPTVINEHGEYGAGNQLIISLSKSAKLDQILNQIKLKAIQCFNMLIEFIQLQKIQVQDQFPAMTISINLVPTICIAARQFATSPELDQLVEDSDLSELIVAMIDFIILGSDSEPLKESKFFDKECQNIVVQIACNLIKLTHSEAQQVIHEPEEYIRLSLDCVDKQKSEIPKTHACKLIERMCDSVHHANMFITKFCCSAINLMFKGATQQDQIYYPGILQMANTETFLKSDPVLVVDACLIILVSMSYLIPTRQDLLEIFEETIETNLQRLVQKPNSSTVDDDILVAAKSVILPTHLSIVIGYYGDLLFKSDAEASKLTLQFLFDSVADNQGKFEVISRGCADTLNIIVTDYETLPHMVQALEMVVDKLLVLIQKIDYTNFFEFLEEFVKVLDKNLVQQHIITIFDTLVNKIVEEQTKKMAGQDYQDIVIQKSIGVIRKCCQINTYMRVHAQTFESSLLKLYKFMEDPQKISFEDDVLFIMQSYVKRTKTVSPVNWELFTKLPFVLEKNKHQFKDLFDVINLFMVEGKEAFTKEIQVVKVVAEMANTALFTQNPSQTVNNTEGALLFQTLFQNMKGSDALNPVFENILDSVCTRMNGDFMPPELKKHILGIFMSAFGYNSTATLRYLENKQMTSALVTEILNIPAKQLKHEYEKRLYILGLVHMLMSDALPPCLQGHIFAMIQSLIDQTSKLNKQIENRKRKEEKEQKDSDDDDDDDDDDDSDEDTDSDDEEKKDGDDDQEVDMNDDGETQITDDKLGFAEKTQDANQNDERIQGDDEDEEVKGNFDKDNESDESDDDAYNEYDPMFDIVTRIDTMKSSYQNIDYHQYFVGMLKSLLQKAPNEIRTLLSQLTDEQKNQLQSLMQTVSVQVQDNQGGTTNVTRRIVKVKRRDPAQLNQASAAAAAAQKQKLELPIQTSGSQQ